MAGYVYIVQGDITLLSAHAIVYSTDRPLSQGGRLYNSFASNIPSFHEQYVALGALETESLPPPGTAYWLPVRRESDGNRLPLGVIPVIATGRRWTREERARLAATAALQLAKEELSRSTVPRPWLVALPCLLTGDGGARHDRLQVAIPQLEVALKFVSENSHIDVVFVAYTESTYQIFLEARRQLLLRHGGPHTDYQPPLALMEAMRANECVVFAGSGVSYGCGLPTWSALIDSLANALDVPLELRRHDLDYFLDLAQWYRDERIQPSLSHRIQQMFVSTHADARPTLAHYLLASLPCRYFITTNYDDMFEVALRALRKHAITIVRESDIALTGNSNRTFVVKLHGDAVTRKNIVLSRDDYDQFFKKRPAMSLFLSSLLLNQSFFFVGYGLRDPDFRHIYANITSILRETKRPAFATTFESPSPLYQRQWRKKRLELMQLEPHDNDTLRSGSDKGRRLAWILDQLNECISQSPHLFLADDVARPRSAASSKLREDLFQLGENIAQACLNITELLSMSEVRELVATLRFLTSHGWRWKSTRLSSLFERVAMSHYLSMGEQQELLLEALRFTEDSLSAKRIERQLRQLGCEI